MIYVIIFLIDFPLRPIKNNVVFFVFIYPCKNFPFLLNYQSNSITTFEFNSIFFSFFQLIALQDQDGDLGPFLSDLTGIPKEELISLRPTFTRCIDWIRAMVFVLLKAEDNAEAATLKARRYLSRHLNEKKAAKLIEKAFLKLKPLVPGLEGKEQLFMRQRSETPSWRQRLSAAAVGGAARGAVEVVVNELIEHLCGL